MSGFGIPVLLEMVRERVGAGMSQEQAVQSVIRDGELRSEAIFALQVSLADEHFGELLWNELHKVGS